MPTNAEAVETLRAARDIVETALGAAIVQRDRQALLAHHDRIAEEIRALHRLQLEAQSVPYAPLTDHIAEAVRKLERLKRRLVRLNQGARTVDQVLGVMARLSVLVAA